MTIPTNAVQSRTDERPVGLVCGAGTMPFAVADAIIRSGRKPILFAFEGHADPVLVAAYTHHWVRLDRPGNLITLMGKLGCRDIVFIGHVVRPRLSDIRLNWQTLKLMPRLLGSFRGGDNHLLSTVGCVLDDVGFRMVGAHEVAPEILVPKGILGKVSPREHDRADIRRAFGVLAAIGPFDVGQAVVVANNHVLAVEGIEGTDLMLDRVAELRRVGRIYSPSGSGILAKAPKRGQDMRYDLPSIGPRTIEGIAAAGLSGIAVSAGSTIMADPQELIALADQAKVFVVGTDDDGTID